MNIALRAVDHTDAAPEFRLLPDARAGAETKLVIRIGPEILADVGKNRRKANVSLLKALNEGQASIVVLTNVSSQGNIGALLADADFATHRCEVHAIDDNEFTDFQYWPRDTLLWATALDDCALAAIDTRHGYPGGLGNWVAGKFAQKTIARKDIRLDGGDSLVIDGKFWIVGDGSVGFMINLARTAIAWRKVLRTIEARMGMKPIAVGISPGRLSRGARWTLSKVRAANLLRIQATLTPAILPVLPQSLPLQAMASLGFVKSWWDPYVNLANWAHIDMAVAVTGKTTSPENKPIVLVAQPTAEGCPKSPDATGMEEVLGAMADRLKRAGLEVIRNPAPFREDRMLLLPYNNVIVQAEPPIVWLPTFASEGMAEKSVDDRNVEIWRKLGFRVIQVPGWYEYSSVFGGCIRCATLPVPSG